MEPRRSSTPAAAPTSTVNANRSALPGESSGLLRLVLVVLLIITAVLASAYLIMRFVDDGANNGTVKPKQFQALFLTNGQVYFGHLSKINAGYVELTDIYYLQVQQTVQPGQASTNNQQVSLAKLGNELHGPEDQMFVAHSQVLFWENLKNSGKVVQAIQNYQSPKPQQ